MKLRLTSRTELLIATAISLLALLFVFTGFEVRPALWFDEGITIEIARNFALFGKLDVLTAPREFSGLAYLVGTNGYPLTVPLALFFSIFGSGLVQARIFMLFWLCATGIALYAVTRKLFGAAAALCAFALAASFASLYATGLTATGEMPGIFFFILGIWFLVGKGQYLATGAAWGLAMAAKPGVFLLLAHTAVLYILIADRKQWFRKLFTAGIGFAVPILLWVLLAFPLTMGTFYSVVSYALNPIDVPVVTSFLDQMPAQTLNEGLIIPATQSASQNVHDNLLRFLTSSTLLYFSLLLVTVSVGLFFGRSAMDIRGRMLCLVLIYGMLTLFFFVRGPGWFRYLIGLQMLLFIPMYPALMGLYEKAADVMSRIPIMAKITPSYAAAGMAGALIALQTVQLAFFSDIPESEKVVEAVSHLQALMSEQPGVTIGIYNIPEIAAFTDPARTYHQSLPQEGMHPLGESPLLMGVLPTLVVMNKQHALVGPAEEAVLAESYVRRTDIPKFEVYERLP